MHLSASTTAFSSTIERASTGQAPTHALQPIQVFLSITTAILTSYMLNLGQTYSVGLFGQGFFSYSPAAVSGLDAKEFCSVVPGVFSHRAWGQAFELGYFFDNMTQVGGGVAFASMRHRSEVG
jgi:hypothetical protein